MMYLSGLTQPEAEVVMQATAQAIRQDVPGVNSADAMEFMYQMANIAKYRWSSPIPSGSELVEKIRSSAEYKNILTRLKAKGTVYASTEDRALSPYFTATGGAPAGGSGDVLDQVKGTLSKVPMWAWIAGGAALAVIVLLPSGRRR